MNARPARQAHLTAARRLTAIALAALLGGCDAMTGESGGSGDSGAPGADAASATVRDSAGVRIVELPDPTSLSPRVLTLDEEWAPNAGLGELVGVAVGEEGRVGLLDAMEASMTILTPEGGFAAWAGGEGDGPGEFQPGGLTHLVATDDGLAVPDLQRQRLTRFAWDGTLLGVDRFPGQGTYAVDWRRHPDGGLAFRALGPTGDALVRWDDAVVDTFHLFEDPEVRFNTALSPVALWDATPDGRLLLGGTDRGRVEARQDGALRWIARLPGDPRPIRDADRQHLVDLVLAVAEARPSEAPPMSRSELLRQIDVSERAPVLAGLRSAPDGSVWVRLAAPVEEMGPEALRVGRAEGYGGPVWVVLEEDGRLRETVRLPDGFEPLTFAGPWLYGYAIAALDVRQPRRVAWAGGEEPS